MLSEKEEMKTARAIRLAGVYGMNVRFFPDGTEGEGDDHGVLGDAIKDGEKAELEDNAEFEKTRQRADQEAANARKAKEQATEAEASREAAREENEQLKQQLADLEAKAADQGVEIPELDEGEYEGGDVKIVRAIKALKSTIEAKDKRLAALEKKASGFEENSRKSAAERARNAQYSEVLTELDSEYGADNRNAAVKAFNALVADGKVPKGNPAKAALAMRRCYKDARAAKDTAKAKKDKSSLKLDSGSGGGSAPNLSGVEIKSGQSLDEAVAQVAAAGSSSQ